MADRVADIKPKTRTLYNQRSQLAFEEHSYGPKASLIKNVPQKTSQYNGTIVDDPSCDYHLEWNSKPENVLLMKKFHDREVTHKFKEIASWLIKEHNIKIFCEPEVLEEEEIKHDTIADMLYTWNEDVKKDALRNVDLIICIGGDGTLLYSSSMFQDQMPPIMSFHMGSLGFLTPFHLEKYKEDIERTINGCPSITLRHRLNCEIRECKTVPIKKNKVQDICQHSPDTNGPSKKPLVKFQTKVLIPTDDLKHEMLVMNELVVDRGPSPYLTNLELFCNERSMTSVQGDGVIIATPTGSTAYSLAAGSSMVHPSVPCMLVTPICPHSLSFRSIVVPAGVEITIRVAENSRNTAWVSFDGRNRQELKQGDSVVVNTSLNPVPSINNTGHVTDWFDSLAECLQWNVRKLQRNLD